jgi:hypothetical protein
MKKESEECSMHSVHGRYDNATRTHKPQFTALLLLTSTTLTYLFVWWIMAKDWDANWTSGRVLRV